MVSAQRNATALQKPSAHGARLMMTLHLGRNSSPCQPISYRWRLVSFLVGQTIWMLYTSVSKPNAIPSPLSLEPVSLLGWEESGNQPWRERMRKSIKTSLTSSAGSRAILSIAYFNAIATWADNYGYSDTKPPVPNRKKLRWSLTGYRIAVNQVPSSSSPIRV